MPTETLNHDVYSVSHGENDNYIYGQKGIVVLDNIKWPHYQQVEKGYLDVYLSYTAIPRVLPGIDLCLISRSRMCGNTFWQTHRLSLNCKENSHIVLGEWKYNITSKYPVLGIRE